MQLKTYLIYCLILYLVLVIRTLLYIEKEKTRRVEKMDGRNRKRENHGEGCRRPLARSSPLLLLRLMSSPSTPSTAAHHLDSLFQQSRRGKGGHLVHFWAMLSPPHRNTSPPTSRPFLASPSAPSDVFTIHTIDSRSHLDSLCQQSGRGKGGHPARLWVIPSIPHRHNIAADRPTTSSRATHRAVCHPTRLVLVLFLQVVRKGSDPARAGDSFPLTMSTLSTLPGCRPHKAVKFFLSSENQGHCRAAGALFQAKGKHSNTFSQLIKSLTEKRGRGIKYSKIASKNKNNNYSVRNINFSPNFN